MNEERGFTGRDCAEVGSQPNPPNPDPFWTLRVPPLGPVATDQSAIASTFGQFISGLPEQIALLDDEWNILAVNPAWMKTAALYGYSALRPGTNYFEFIRERVAEGHAWAEPVFAGVMGMVQGAKTSFSALFHGTDRWDGYTFQLCVNRFEMRGKPFVTVTRYDVTELEQLRRDRETYSHSLIEGQAEERRRIAREIHDSTSQLLVGLGLDIGQLKRAGRSNKTPGIIADMELLLDEAQREIRSISFLAHPPLLRERGLAEALKALVSGFGRRTGLQISLEMAESLVVDWPAVELTFYRFIQEALSNVHRHARASEVRVGVHLRRSMIHAVVSDNGIGLTSEQPGVGFSSMRSRATEFGGRLFIRPSFPGVALIVSLPMQPRLRATGDLAANKI